MASEDIRDWCTQNFNLTLEDLISNLGDDSSLLDELGDSGLGPASPVPADWAAPDDLVKQETASPPPAVPQAVKPAPPQRQAPLLIDGKAYVINGSVATPLAAPAGRIIKPEQRSIASAAVSTAAPVLYSTQVLAGAPTLVTTGFPLLLEPADRLPIGKLSSPAGGQHGSEPPRRNSHNAIEKRYRTSINDKIQDMRILVCGPDSDAKMTKSAILKKALDYIRYLRNQNHRLREELRLLRPPLDPATARLEDLLRSPVLDSPPHSAESGPSSPELGASSVGTGSPPPPDSPPSAQERSPPGLSDRARMTLCMFLLCFLALDPVRQLSDWGRETLLPPQHSTVAGRTMLSAESDGGRWWSYLLLPLAVWVTNAVVLVICLLNIFIYGEAKVALNSGAAREFWMWKEQAERDYRQGQTAEAGSHLRRALRALGRPLPGSRLQWTVALLWQVFRQASHHIPGGLWLARRGHRFLMARRQREDLYMMSAGYARVYHRLHQLCLSGHGPPGAAAGLTLALSALNYAEVAGGTLSPSGRAHVFACAALQLKQSLPEPLLWLARLMLAKGLRGLETVPPALRWLATDDGQRFFMDHKWTYEPERASLFSATAPASPLLYARGLFHEHLLERTLQTLTMPGARCVDVCDAALLRRSHMADALRYCQLIMDTTEPPGPDVAAEDAAIRWWAGVAELVAVWWLGQDERADQLFGRVEALPATLRDSSDPLPRAVRVAVQAWRTQAHGGGAPQVLAACRAAAALLEESVAGGQCPGATSVASQHLQLLVCDLLLQTRTVVWEQRPRAPPQPRELAEFQQTLGCLRAVSVWLPSALSRVFLHEATVRMMAGAAPGRTQQLLERSLRHRSGRSYSVLCGSETQPHQYVGEREHAIALMMACKHLPEGLLSCPGERAGMLAEAASVLEKIGDKRRLNDCFQMLKSVGASFPSGS